MKWSKKDKIIKIRTTKETQKMFKHFKIDYEFATSHDMIKYLLTHNDKIRPKSMFKED